VVINFEQRWWKKLRKEGAWRDLLPGEAAGDAVLESIPQGSLATGSRPGEGRQVGVLAVLHHGGYVRGGRGDRRAGVLHDRRLVVVIVLVVRLLVVWRPRARSGSRTRRPCRRISAVQGAPERAVARRVFARHYGSVAISIKRFGLAVSYR